MAFRNLDPDVAYVGKAACAQCHADKFNTFTVSQMGRSFKPGSVEGSAAKWADAEPVYDPHRDLYYQAFNRGEDLLVMEFRISNGDTVHKRIEKIDYIVGSGQHTNSHMMDVNGFLYQIPITWYAQDGRWDLPPGFENNNSRFSRPITQACMGCHNAISSFVEGSENRFTELAEGIDCERCHGPGELHVSEKLEGQIVDVREGIDYSIVNPAKLPIERQFDVCQRCHMQGATVYEDGKTPYDFRPGMDLGSIMNVYTPRYSDSTSRFIMASHPDRLQMSHCFLESREASFEPLTCTTCHDPHLPIETLGRDHYQSVCQSCHATAPVDESLRRSPAYSKTSGTSDSSGDVAPPCAAPSSLRLEQNNDCVACHMPKSGSADIPHVSVTDHYIRVAGIPGERQTVSENEFVGLASLIHDEASDLDLASGYMAYFEEVSDIPFFLDSAAVHLERAKSDGAIEALAPKFVRLRFLEEDFSAIVSLVRDVGPEVFQDAWSYYRIGEAYAALGDEAEAAEYFLKAVEDNPEHLRFRNRLGMTYTSSGRFDEAIRMFDIVLNSHPKYEDAYNNRGFARAMQGDLSGAEGDFLMAVSLNPDAYQALANLSSLYINTDQSEKARVYVERLLEYDPKNEGYQRLKDLVDNDR